MVVVAAGVAFVDDQPIGRLYPYVDARRDEFLGRGLQRRAIETVGYLVVFPGVVVIAFGHLASVGFGRIVFAFARYNGKAERLAGGDVRLEKQGLRLLLSGVDRLRGHLHPFGVEHHDVFGRHAAQRGYFAPRDFHALGFALRLRRIAYFDLHVLRAGCERQECGARNDFTNHDVEFCLRWLYRKITHFSLTSQSKRQIMYSIDKYYT